MKRMIMFSTIIVMLAGTIVSCSSGGDGETAQQDTQLTGTVQVTGGSNQQ